MIIFEFFLLFVFDFFCEESGLLGICAWWVVCILIEYGTYDDEKGSSSSTVPEVHRKNESMIEGVLLVCVLNDGTRGILLRTIAIPGI